MWLIINRLLRRLALVAEALIGVVFSLIRGIFFWRKRPVEVRIYNLIRHPRGIYFFGRALAEKKLRPPREDDGPWINFQRILSQFTTRKSPKAKVRLQWDQESTVIRATRDGYVQADLPLSTAQSLLVSLPDAEWNISYPIRGSSEIEDFLIISDVDDTLIETGATAFRTMIATTIFGNALTRKIIPGMPELLLALQKNGKNPLFTLTSSPWNLESFLRGVFQRVGLTVDGIFMTDWGLNVDQWIHPDHGEHKLHSIRRLLRWFPEQKIVLFGDDTQMDPEVYTEIASEYPKRVRGIFIRCISGNARQRRVEQLLADCAQRCDLIAACNLSPDQIFSSLFPLDLREF